MSVDSKHIPITSPCPITLDRSGVSEEDRRLHCAHCVKDVHLLSNMTEREARDFLEDQSGRDICVSYAIKGDGGIRFRAEAPASCSPAPTATFVPRHSLMRHLPERPRVGARHTARASAPASMLASLGAALLLAACAPHSDAGAIRVDEETPAPVVQEVVIPTETPCDSDQVVEGGLEVMPPPDDVQVDGGIKVEPPPVEKHVAGGLRAMPVPSPIPEPVVEGPELHTPPPAEAPGETDKQVRGRISLVDRNPDALEPVD